MRQIQSKSRSMRRLSLWLAAVSLLLTGCRDNPQDKAAKEVHQQIQAALAQSDVVAAQQQIQSAISRYRPTGSAQDSANLVSGHLTLSRGHTQRTELPLKTVPVRNAADAIAAQLVLSQQWLLEKERIDKMLALHDSEIVELNALIIGTSAQPGLQTRLSEAQAERAEHLSQKQAVQKEKDKIQAVIDDYQTRSETLLKQADMAKGDEKLSLQQQAYTLMLQRKNDYVQAQTAEHKIALLDDQIALIETRVRSLQDNLKKTQEQIAALETAPSRQLLKTQQTEITQLLSDRQKRIYEHADAIKTGLDAYRQAAQEVADILRQAAEHYQKVRSPNAALAAVMRQADCYACAAMAGAEEILFLRELAARLSGIVAAADETLTLGLAERLPLSADLDPEQLQTVIAFFDEADKAYEDAMERARRIPERGREAAVSVLKSQLLAVQSKMQLADALAQYDLASQTQTRLEELKQKGQGFGSLFTFSETARLLDKGLAFVPSLPVNVELYFEGIRQRFAEWKRLATPAQQAAAVEKNLAEMDELVRAYGDEMSRLIEPLKQEMLAAKERGFVVPVAAPTASGEPNSP